MSPSRTRPPVRQSDLSLLLLCGAALTLLHVAVNGRYGFHRDELLSLDNARHLAWGYVVYPPLTPFLARIELFFGASVRGYRIFAAGTQGLAFVFTGLMAREMGGRRWAQIVAASAVAISGFSLFNGGFLSYTTFDYLWWILAAYFAVRLLRTQDARWWLAIGAAIGLGLMTRYTIGLLILGIPGGLILTRGRRQFRSWWFWGGAALTVAICLPNFLWQAHHHFIWLQWFHSIHARDLRQGRAENFLLNQLWITTSPASVPFWVTGLWFLFRKAEGKPYRLLGWMYVIPLLVLLAARGRDYYLAPAYPMLLAAGAVEAERWLTTVRSGVAISLRHATGYGFALSGLSIAALALPIAPIGSTWWRIADHANDCFNSEIGWPEMVATAARVRDRLSPQDRSRFAILAGDDGETGAIDLYGSAYGLPPAISGMNSAWARGYGDPPPEVIIAVNMERDFLQRHFTSCQAAAELPHPWGISNEAVPNDTIYVCRNLREGWPEFWAHFQYYG